MKEFTQYRSAALVALAGLALAAPAIAQVLPTGVRTIFLERGPGTGSTPVAVAYHPTFDRYYASHGGNPGFAAWVYNSSGTRIQDLGALGIDARGWNYNRNTNRLEVNAFNSTVNGLWEAGVDGSGNLTGVATQLLTSLAAAGSQSMMAYDAVRDVLYSRESAATVNVIRRSDGGLSSQFNLDFGAAGVTASNVTTFAIGYDVDADLVWVTDHTNDRALAFDRTGAFVGASTLDIDVQSSFRMGYAKGQIFVFDVARNGWQGYQVAAGQSLTTTFASNNQFAGNMFDLTALNPAGITIESWDVNISLPGQQARISVFYRTDSYLNAQNTQAGWIEVGTQTVTSAGQDQPTPVPIGGVTIPGGATYGFYVFVTDYTVNPAPPGVPVMFYTNIPPALNQYATADLRLDGGIGKGSPPFTGDTFNPRMWNGTVYYSIGAGACYPDCDTSTGPRILDIFDFLCFGNRFAAGDPYACDCDQTTGPGVCDIFDFLCFGNAFNAGCP